MYVFYGACKSNIAVSLFTNHPCSFLASWAFCTPARHQNMLSEWFYIAVFVSVKKPRPVHIFKQVNTFSSVGAGFQAVNLVAYHTLVIHPRAQKTRELVRKRVCHPTRPQHWITIACVGTPSEMPFHMCANLTVNIMCNSASITN
jgi:hypothetical protein